MQENLFFWNAWNKPFRAFYLTLLSLLAVCICFLGFSFFMGETLTIGWEKDVDLEVIGIPTDTKTIDFFNYTLETNVYITRSWINNGTVKLYPVVAYTYLLIITGTVVILLTIFTFLDLAYFLIGMTAIVAFLVSLNTELLAMFGWQNRGFTVLLIALYAGLAYWIHAFKTDLDFFKRIQLFSALSIGIGICIGVFSKAPQPFLQLAQSSLLLSFGAALLFLFMIGYENIRSFFYISSVSAQQDGKKSLLHFSIISVLYIGNTFLLWTKGKVFQEELGLILIHPLLLFLSAALVGIYGYKKRSVLFSDTLPFKPLGAIFYLCLFIITTATLGYAYFSANDALHNSIEYLIVFSQLCLSIAFLLYVWINFAAPLLKNIKVYPYLFEAKFTPLFIAQGLGIIGIFSLIALSHYFPYKQAVSSHYIQLGDYFASTEDTVLAKEYYNEAQLWDNLGHRANYALAQIAEKEERWDIAYQHYNNCLRRKPSTYAVIGLSGVYQHQKQLFPSFFMLKDGVNLFPQSGEVKNNLGLTYHTLNIKDSAAYMLQEAYKSVPSDAATNLLYLMLKSGDYSQADSLTQALGTFDEMPFENNLMAVQAAIGKQSVSNRFEQTLTQASDSLLSPQRFTNIYNYSINHMDANDTSMVRKLNTWIQTEANEGYREDLLIAKSMNQYYASHEARSALITFHELELQHPSTYFYPLVLAHWYVSKHRFDLAAEYYFKALNNGSQKAQIMYVLTLLESQQYTKASIYLEQWLKSPEPDKLTIARLAQSIAKLKNSTDALSQGDLIKLRYIRWNIAQQEINERQQVALSIKSDEIKAQACLALMEEWMAKQQYNEALSLWNSLAQSGKATPETMAWGDALYLKLLVALQDWETLKTESQKINSDKQAYYKGIDAIIQKDSTTAAKNFIKALSADPLEETLAARAVFFLGERDFMGYYELILAQLLAYPESVKLSEAYMILCLNNSMNSFAEGELQRIEPYLSPDRYNFWKEKIKQSVIIN